jgi:RNA polymerase I-specific transcription initiation factor RRN7
VKVYFTLILMIIVEIYPAVGRLAKLLDLDFSWPVTTKKLQGVSAYPELQMISLIVIATKLGHPFDDIDRIPETDADPTILKIDWSKWIRTMEEHPSRGLKRGEEVKVTDTDVWSMNAKKVDDYLDWYQRAWVDDRDPKSMYSKFFLFE